MNNVVVIVLVIISSLVLGFIKYKSLSDSYKNATKYLKFVEFWNDTANFFISGLIGYFYLVVRFPQLVNAQPVAASDFILLVFFMMGLFGHLPVLSKNITDGIEAILKRVLERS